jgi:outer membrane protein assembly factor BamA
MRSFPASLHRGVPALLACALAMASVSASAQRSEAAVQADSTSLAAEERSPWLLAPIFSSNPKLGTSVGALAGYLHYFDAKSRPSILAVSAQYSDTGSLVGGVFGKSSFHEDHHRLTAGLVYGNVKNDYDDYLGSGIPLRNDAEMRALFARYLYRVKGDGFVGVQGVYQNFGIAGDTAFDDQILDIVGLKPFKSAALGLVLQADSRDSENLPSRGWLLNLNNLAFRESLGSESDYDVYRLELRHYVPHGSRNVFAMRINNQLTNDAPAAARAPVQLRGYKVGQYAGKNMSSIEGEERFRLAEKWTATLFAGVACLYGEGNSCSDSANLYGAAGAGVQYILKPKEGIVLNLEYAAGEDGNYGVYLKMGYAF